MKRMMKDSLAPTAQEMLKGSSRPGMRPRPNNSTHHCCNYSEEKRLKTKVREVTQQKKILYFFLNGNCLNQISEGEMYLK